MRNVDEVFSIIKMIAEKEGFPISHIIQNYQYFSDKYAISIDKKEMSNLKTTLKTKVNIDDFTKLKLDLFK
jgi:flagellar assembly factor FliW